MTTHNPTESQSQVPSLEARADALSREEMRTSRRSFLKLAGLGLGVVAAQPALHACKAYRDFYRYHPNDKTAPRFTEPLTWLLNPAGIVGDLVTTPLRVVQNLGDVILDRSEYKLVENPDGTSKHVLDPNYSSFFGTVADGTRHGFEFLPISRALLQTFDYGRWRQTKEDAGKTDEVDLAYAKSIVQTLLLLAAGGFGGYQIFSGNGSGGGDRDDPIFSDPNGGSGPGGGIFGNQSSVPIYMLDKKSGDLYCGQLIKSDKNGSNARLTAFWRVESAEDLPSYRPGSSRPYASADEALTDLTEQHTRGMLALDAAKVTGKVRYASGSR